MPSLQPRRPEVWESLLGRPPTCIDWDPAALPSRLGDDLASAVGPLLREIAAAELARFPIGPEHGIERIAAGGHLVVVAGHDDTALEALAFIRESLRAAAARGASRALLLCDADAAVSPAGPVDRRRRRRRRGALRARRRPAPWRHRPSRAEARVNALSTCAMAGMRRVIGNCMACVTRPNGKLVDRGTRYVGQLAGLEYEDARRVLREAFLYVAPRMVAGAAYPQVVPLAVDAVRDGVSFEAAEVALDYGRPHPAQASTRTA